MKVSVITAVRNEVRAIEATIQSVLAQRGVELEYIVIDGASNDGTTDVIRRYESRLARVIVEPDAGLYDALNKGIAVATGDAVAILNAGDTYASDTALSRLGAALGDPAADRIAYGAMRVQDRDGANPRILGEGVGGAGLFLRGCDVPHPTTLIPRRLYREHGGYSLGWRIQADYDLLLRMHRAGVAFVDCKAEVVVFARGGLSSDFWQCWREAHAVRRANGIGALTNAVFSARSAVAYVLAGLLGRRR